MTDSLIAIILGIIEGLTEFIPVSSTGHLILAGDALSFKNAHSATFDIAIQLGAILAVVVLYRQFFWETFKPSAWFSPNMNKILLAMTPVMGVAFFAYSAIKTYLFSSFTVAIGLIIGGVIMIIVEKWVNPTPTTHEIDDMSYKQALGVGIAQCFSLWPGTSRSGATIVGGLLTGLSYKLAARFSFIVAVPVMTIAVAYDMLKSMSHITLYDLQLIGIGFVVSFIVALIAIKTFINWLNKTKLVPFAIYRILLALFVLWTLS